MENEDSGGQQSGSRHGEANQSMHINNETPDFLNKIPGGGLLAVDYAGEDKIPQTFGMIKTELVGSAGQKLNPAANIKATIKKF